MASGSLHSSIYSHEDYRSCTQKTIMHTPELNVREARRAAGVARLPVCVEAVTQCRNLISGFRLHSVIKARSCAG